MAARQSALATSMRRYNRSIPVTRFDPRVFLRLVPVAAHDRSSASRANRASAANTLRRRLVPPPAGVALMVMLLAAATAAPAAAQPSTDVAQRPRIGLVLS